MARRRAMSVEKFPERVLAWAEARGSVISAQPALERSQGEMVDYPLRAATDLALAKRMAHRRPPYAAPGLPWLG